MKIEFLYLYYTPDKQTFQQISSANAIFRQSYGLSKEVPITWFRQNRQNYISKIT